MIDLSRASRVSVLAMTLTMGFAQHALADHNGLIARYTTAGALDTTFNGTGKVTSTNPNDDNGLDLVIDSSGRIVTCGSVADSTGKFQIVVGRTNVNGSADTTFGWFGVTTISWPQETGATACKIDASGRIVVVSEEGRSFPTGSYLVARYTPTGALDSTFSGDGITTVHLGTTLAVPSDLVITSAGKIYITGIVDSDLFITRHNADGSLDTAFSGDGIRIDNLGAGFDQAHAIALDSSSRPVIVGVSDATPNNMLLMRYTTAGALDTTFDGDGKRFVSFPGTTGPAAESVLIDGSGRIVVAGHTFVSSGGNEIAVARMSAAGVLDTTFDGDGLQLTPFAGGEVSGQDVVLTSDNKLIVAGYYSPTSGGFQVALTRYTSAGALDTTFNSSGKVATSFAPKSGSAYAVVVDASNRPVIVGEVQ